jgi:Mrp family chromosome partitioning ATPase
MKAITVFSGKGGVGKSTISALLALALSKKHKVVLLDMDINTPSVPVMFGPKKEIGNLHLISTGYDSDSKNMMAFTGKVARKILNGLVKEVNEMDPEIVIMDMPPGLGDVQLEVAAKLKPSSFLLVVQPNKLCEEDAMRATQLFARTQIPIAGMIENMAGQVFGESKSIDIMGLPVLASLSLREDIAIAGSSGKMSEITNNPFDAIAEDLFNKATDIEWIFGKSPFYEGVNKDKMIEDMSDKEKERLPKKVKFIGLNSWDYIRDVLLSQQPYLDRMLLENSTEVIRNMLEGLDEREEGLFMITKPPCTVIKLFPGEIGTARLYKEGLYYYNLPRVAYATDEGEVVLFPNEVSPVTKKVLMKHQKSGELVLAPKSTTPRYIPSVEALEGIDEFFGRICRTPKNWREEYRKLGMEVPMEVEINDTIGNDSD